MIGKGERRRWRGEGEVWGDPASRLVRFKPSAAPEVVTMSGKEAEDLAALLLLASVDLKVEGAP